MATLCLSVYACAFSGSGNGTNQDGSSPSTPDYPAEPGPGSHQAAPTVVVAPSGRNVGTNTYITAIFSSDMDPATINAQTFLVKNANTGTAVKGTVSAGSTVAVFAPDHVFDPNTTYIITFTADVKDYRADQLSFPKPLTFTTGAEADTTPPAIIPESIDPKDGAKNVSINDAVTLRFSKAMSTSTVSSGLTIDNVAELDFSYDASTNKVTARPKAALQYNTNYTVRLRGLKSLTGVPLPDTSWSFKTIAQADTTPPQVTINLVQPDGSGGTKRCVSESAAGNCYIDIVFSEKINADTRYNIPQEVKSNPTETIPAKTYYSLKSSKTGTTVPVDLGWWYGYAEARVDMYALESYTTYTFTVSREVMDVAKNKMVADFTFPFTTADVEPPYWQEDKDKHIHPPTMAADRASKQLIVNWPEHAVDDGTGVGQYQVTCPDVQPTYSNSFASDVQVPRQIVVPGASDLIEYRCDFKSCDNSGNCLLNKVYATISPQPALNVTASDTQSVGNCGEGQGAVTIQWQPNGQNAGASDLQYRVYIRYDDPAIPANTSDAGDPKASPPKPPKGWSHVFDAYITNYAGAPKMVNYSGTSATVCQTYAIGNNAGLTAWFAVTAVNKPTTFYDGVESDFSEASSPISITPPPPPSPDNP